MKKFFYAMVSAALLVSCTGAGEVTPGWKESFDGMVPLLGHRNWIVVADMAYPLQSGQGIRTLYAPEGYLDVLSYVKEAVDSAPHILAHIYRDKELEFITEDMVEGIDSLKKGIAAVCGDEARSVMHEELISRLDSAGKLFNVVIIKTPLTVPYTTTFFELDCDYWTGDQQAALDALIEMNDTK